MGFSRNERVVQDKLNGIKIDAVGSLKVLIFAANPQDSSDSAMLPL